MPKRLPSCTIIVLNWNGRELLAEGLPSVVSACSRSGSRTDILVVDNGSDDGSVEFIAQRFPTVGVQALGRNLGFGEGNNEGVRRATGDVVVLLNNDMVVEPDFLEPLLRPFAGDDNLFAVGSQIFFQDRDRPREETGKTFAYWDKGTIRYMHQEITALDEQRAMVPIFWASGGAVAFDRSKFLTLGGFRAIFSPAYVEDVDISYRAHRRGWHVVVAPASRVHHKHRASSGRRFDARGLELLVRRNRLLFLWANVSDLKLLLAHLATLPFRILKDGWRDRRWLDLGAFLAALPRLPHALGLNIADARHRRSRDRDFLCSFAWRAQFLTGQQRLSILFVCPYVPCVGIHAGGQRMFEIIKGMGGYHDVSVLAYHEDDEEASRVEGLRPFCRSVVTLRRWQSGGEPDWFHILPHRPVKEFCNPAMKTMLFDEVRSGKYDLVQFEYLEMAHLARYLRGLNVPMILTEHEVQSRMMMQAVRNGELPRWEKAEQFVQWMKMMPYEIATAGLMDGVIAMTEDERDSLLQYDRTLPIRVNHTGVHVAYFSSAPAVPPDPHTLVFVGYFRHTPNVDAMEWFCDSIYPAILNRYPSARLFIVGAEPPERIRQLHNGQSVVVTGRVDDIRPWMARASLYIIPMRLGAGIRGKVLEAWAMRKPVVCSPIAASGIRAEHGKNIFIAGTRAEFVDTIIHLFENSDERARVGEEGYRTVVEHFDWPRQVAKHAGLYAGFLRDSRRGRS